MQSFLSRITEAAARPAAPPPPAALEPSPITGNAVADITVPQLLQLGTPMTKVTAKKQKKAVFRLDADQGQILWESKRHRIIPIENIKELRAGADARYYREQFRLAQEYEDRWLTIVYLREGEYKTLHLIAATADVFRMWDATLRKLHAIRQELMSGLGNIEMREAIWEKQYWKGADNERDQRLDFDDVERLCQRLHINYPTEELRRLFRKADVQNRGYLDFDDFRRFVKLLKARPEVDQLYKECCADGNGTFDATTFEKFMRDQQKSSLSSGELKILFDKYATPAQPGGPMSIDGFTAFLLSPDNAAFADQNANVWHDMTRPLSEYFISSSHNTYLVGHQLVGVSTIEGYIRALLHGCRSVELDIYDGEREPMVFHGKTFTSKVSLREICAAIAKYGFVASPYPVIISAEIHCGLAQQDMMVSIMNEVFGDALVSAPVEGRPRLEVLPSPEALRGRFLLKAKNLNIVADREAVVADSDTSASSGSSSSDSDAVQELKDEFRRVRQLEADAMKDIKQDWSRARGVMKRMKNAGKAAIPNGSSSAGAAQKLAPEASASPPSPSAPSTLRAVEPAPKAKMSFALTALLVYTVGVKWRGINKKEAYAPEHIVSLSETAANRLIKTAAGDLAKHTRTHIVRIYPKGLRLSSSNYAPHPFWAAGAQLVAINWQTFDLGYMINHTMFQRNGRAGYVLKPAVLRTPDRAALAQRISRVLVVRVISAQQLPHAADAPDAAAVDPLVEVALYTPDAPGAPALARTGVVRRNGFNPVWDEALRVPFAAARGLDDVVFVRFAVLQDGAEDGTPRAAYCVPLGSLQAGFRHLPLHDAQLSQYLFSTLFVHIAIEDTNPAA